MKVSSYRIDREFLYNVETPVQTDTYKPVSHKSIIETTLEGIEKSGLVLTEEVYRSAREGKQAIGEYRFSPEEDGDIGMSIIWQNSLDKTMTLKYVSGYYTFVCSNGQIYGDNGGFKKRHVGEIQHLTPLEITNQLDGAREKFSAAIVLKNRMKEIEVTKATCSNLIGRLFMEEDLLQTTQLEIIKKEFRMPSFDYGVEDSLWNLYSNITHSYKELHPRVYIQKQIALSNFFEHEYELL